MPHNKGRRRISATLKTEPTLKVARPLTRPECHVDVSKKHFPAGFSRNLIPLLLQDGTIGEELVVKPAPESVTKFASQFSRLPDWDNWGANTISNSSRRRDDVDDDDEEELPVDYAFLDEDELSDYNAIGSDLRSMRRRRRSADLGQEPCLETGAHIVFRRRRPESETHHHDYGEICFASFSATIKPVVALGFCKKPPRTASHMI